MKSTLIGPDNLEVDAVVPQCLDNQYVSDRVFSEMVKRDIDFRDRIIAESRENAFRTEFIRSLVYSSQVIVQRAFFKNSEFLYKNYLPENGNDLKAFAKLMKEKAIVPYLFKESSLTDGLEFDVRADGDRATRALVDEIGEAVTCVRLAIDDPTNNKATDSMATEFGAKLARLEFMNAEQRNAMASELFVDPGRLQQEGAWQAFDDAIDQLVDYSIKKGRELRKTSDKPLTRQDIYRDNFIAGQDDGNVAIGRFIKPGTENPFMLELKKYVDLVYNTNLPDHLKRYTFTPANMPTRMALQDMPGEGYSHEQLSNVVSDSDALESIQRTFIAHSQKAMNLPILHELTVADVLEIRDLPEWYQFKESQAKVLKNPLQCLDRLENFQLCFDQFQSALSQWYNQKYKKTRTEEKYCSYISLALSLGGKLLVAGSNMGTYEKALSMFASDRLIGTIPNKVKGYAAKLMVGVYDVGKQQLDADRTYTVSLMQTNAEIMKKDVIELLNSMRRKAGVDMPGTAEHVADQGI